MALALGHSLFSRGDREINGQTAGRGILGEKINGALWKHQGGNNQSQHKCPLTPKPQQKEHSSGCEHTGLEVDYTLAQLEAISPAAVTGEARRMLNTEAESRMRHPSAGAIWTSKVDVGSWDKAWSKSPLHQWALPRPCPGSSWEPSAGGGDPSLLDLPRTPASQLILDAEGRTLGSTACKTLCQAPCQVWE